ncbi:uridine kinase [Anaerocolumna cellulosilytica]|uniref:Uridine kinase n=1 Tax=Anaerocolumna cellulosilytica TaxID=433286 RepID=A0A6S6R2E1_9FIRM|nr:nucleoside kinase [Anaerocolumna cellulosilytica]MBB5194407.1 uridine kinase [Anaerocolumna cellulosilytica]BCJ93351.1 uridine kinase [Anaerocolumna cellulosilytica]
MEEKVQIEIDGEIKVYPKGIRLLDISREYQKNYKEDIILAYINNKLRELPKTVQKDCKIRFVTTADDAGHKTYNRGLTLVMLKAMYSVIGADNINKISVEFSIGNGLYCQPDIKVPITEGLCKAIKEKMEDLIQKDFPIMKRSMGTDDAIELFNFYGMHDKEKLFHYRRVSKANIYNLEGFEDYYYGYMPPSTGMLKYFDLFPYGGGVILLLPEKRSTKELEAFVPQEKLFYTLMESNRSSSNMEIETVGALNDAIVEGRINDLILTQEALQEMKIGEIAEQIKTSGKKFVMIAGPSSSGKTTFSHRLSIQLKTHGLTPHPIAVDDYFVERDMTPLDEEGKPNYESLYSIDLESFNKDMTDLLAGKTVELPSFNFKTGHREYKGKYKTLGANDILVIEGIHGLNDKMSYSLPRESKFKIYISALTSLNIDEHNRIPTTDLRLIRRMVRDARTRGVSGTQTINMWPSVRRGEEENIFPYQEDSDVMFNSALIYELAILKQYAEPVLFGIRKDSEEYVEAKRLLKFLDYFLGVSSEAVPQNSILKEFVGGSCFKV